MTASLQISTEAYEGPIDLFYELVVTNRIDPSALSLSAMVDSFLSGLADGAPVELEHLSEFILVLALLCRLKARRLLGRRRDFPEEEPVENPDRDLWYQLSRLTFGEAVQELAALLERRSGLRSREAGPDWSMMETTPRLAFRLEAGNLAELAGEIMSRVRDAPDLDHLALDLPTVEEAMSALWRLIGRIRESSFDEMSPHWGDRAEEAVWFMGLMELARQGRVRISQVAPGDDILIRRDSTPAPVMAAARGPA